MEITLTYILMFLPMRQMTGSGSIKVTVPIPNNLLLISDSLPERFSLKLRTTSGNSSPDNSTCTLERINIMPDGKVK